MYSTTLPSLPFLTWCAVNNSQSEKVNTTSKEQSHSSLKLIYIQKEFIGTLKGTSPPRYTFLRLRTLPQEKALRTQILP